MAKAKLIDSFKFDWCSGHNEQNKKLDLIRSDIISFSQFILFYVYVKFYQYDEKKTHCTGTLFSHVYIFLKGNRGFHMAEVRQKGRKRKKVQYASPVRKMRRHKQKAHHVSSSTSSSGEIN